MIVVADIVTALSAGNDTLRAVGTARDLNEARINTLTWPSAWVVNLAETSGSNKFASCDIVDQRVIDRFGVILAVRDIADHEGRFALSEIERVRTGTIEALARFQPVNAETTCVHRQGRLISSIGKDGQMFWQDDFEVEFSRRITGVSS